MIRNSQNNALSLNICIQLKSIFKSSHPFVLYTLRYKQSIIYIIFMEPETNDLSQSINIQSNNKKKSKKAVNITAEEVITIFKAAQQNEEGNTVLAQLLLLNLKSISYKQLEALRSQIEKAIQIYYPSLSLLSQQKNQDGEQIQKQVRGFAEQFHCIIKCMKQNQFMPTVSDLFVELFIEVCKKFMKHPQLLFLKQYALSMWQDIPPRNFLHFLSQLGLKDAYNQIDPDMMNKILIALINDSKITQCCTYYKSYYPKLPKLESELLAPKIANSDQLLSPPVLELLKKKADIKLQVLGQIDLGKAIILVEQLGQDPRQYPQLQNFIMRRHYLAMLRQYKFWYIFEDKMCFNPKFIQMYCLEAEKIQKPPEDSKHIFPQNKNVITSMRYRNLQNIQKTQQLISNPLVTYDYFGITQKILLEHTNQHHHEEGHEQYLQLRDYEIDESMVIFIDKIDEEFDLMSEDVLSSTSVGFDAENRCTSTKYEQQGVSLLQISTSKRIYILDFLHLEDNQKFQDFLKAFLAKEQLSKIGHTVNSDIRYLQKTCKIQLCRGFVDIASLFKNKFPAEAQNSLAFMVSKLIGKKLSKYEQRSNWNRRPLKKTQLHYAALDAKVCQNLFSLLNQKNLEINSTIQAKRVQKKDDDIIRTERLAYSKKFEYLLKEDRPKFLVDNMLKKVCSNMRNLGIDTEYISVSNFQLMKATAEKQQRIIITRDMKLLKKSKITVPIYCISHKGDSDQMFDEVKAAFKLQLNLFKTLSRCVKCNSLDLEVIGKEEAMKFLVFHHVNNEIEQFWRCQKCKQIYWEGNQFKNAKNKFEGMK